MSSEKSQKVSRRSFIKYGIAGAIAVAAAVGGFFAGRATVPTAPSPPTRPTLPAAKQPIKVGVLSPLTGPYSADGRRQTLGVHLAVKEINDKGGLLGRKLEIYERDHEVSIGVATRRAKELLDSVKVDMITGFLMTAVAHAVNDLIKKSKTIAMSGCCQVYDTLKKGVLSKYFWGVFPPCIVMNKATSKFAAKNFGKRWYINYMDYSYGQEHAELYMKHAKELGCEIVAKPDPIPMDTTDFSSFIAKAAAAKPDVIISATFGTLCVNFIKQAKEFGLMEKIPILIPTATMTQALMTGAETFGGVYASLYFYWELPRYDRSRYGPTEEFVKKYWAAYGEPPDSYAACTYNCVRIWADAVEKAGTTDADAVTEELLKQKSNYVKGPEYFRVCDHALVQDWFIARAKPPEKIKEKYDVWEIVGVEKGEDLLYSCKELGW